MRKSHEIGSTCCKRFLWLAAFCISVSTSSAEDRFSFWQFPGMASGGLYLPLRIEPDDGTVVFVAAQAISRNGSVIFVSAGPIRLEISAEGRQSTEELLELPIDATPEFYLNIMHGRGPEVLQFNREKLRELVVRFQTANHMASGTALRSSAEYRISISIPLYVVDAKSQTFIVGRWLTSEPLLVRIADGRLTLIGYCADRFLGGTFGMRRTDSDR